MNIQAEFSTDSVVQWSEGVSPHSGEMNYYETSRHYMEYDFAAGFLLPMTNPR